MGVERVTMEEGSRIIGAYARGRAPKGLYMFKEDEWWIGIDNSTNDCWVEEFITEDLCIRWLNREFEMSELEPR